MWICVRDEWRHRLAIAFCSHRQSVFVYVSPAEGATFFKFRDASLYVATTTWLHRMEIPYREIPIRAELPDRTD